jgi:hypothetical protein
MGLCDLCELCGEMFGLMARWLNKGGVEMEQLACTDR